MSKTAGALWISGSTLHFCDKDGVEWYFTGTAGTTPAGAHTGALWIDSVTGTLHYIDASGVDRAVPKALIANRPSAGVGALWIETTAPTNYSLHLTDGANNEQACHDDIALVPHSDVAYVSHSDVTYVAHSDVSTYLAYEAHDDYHLDGVSGAYNPYSDHQDTPGISTGAYPYHADVGRVNHTDTTYHNTAHTDVAYSHNDVSYSHDDVPAVEYSDHADHTDGMDYEYHTDDIHTPHSDVTVPHTDTTVPHTDVAHVDYYTGGYTDSHTDATSTLQSHTDVATVPHTDVTTVPHADIALVPHSDQPTSLGA